MSIKQLFQSFRRHPAEVPVSREAESPAQQHAETAPACEAPREGADTGRDLGNAAARGVVQGSVSKAVEKFWDLFG
ncbi:hypothetical protein ACQB60_40425 [Actinomycetota bacterium Odt1-20B]